MLGSKPVVTKDLVQLMAAWQLATYSFKQLEVWYKEGWINAKELSKAVNIRDKSLSNVDAQLKLTIDEQEL